MTRDADDDVGMKIKYKQISNEVINIHTYTLTLARTIHCNIKLQTNISVNNSRSPRDSKQIVY